MMPIPLLWNVCQIDFVECVSKIEHILLVIHYSIYGAVCFQFTQLPRHCWENIVYEVWIIIHCLGLGHETMVCAVCLFIFLFSHGYHRKLNMHIMYGIGDFISIDLEIKLRLLSLGTFHNQIATNVRRGYHKHHSLMIKEIYTYMPSKVILE